MRVALFITSLPEDDLKNRQFPLGVGYLAAYLEKHLADVETLLSADPDEVIAWRPDLVAISSVSQCFASAIDLASSVERSLGVPVVLGGYHISSLPHTLPGVFRAGVLGEGEETFLTLVDAYRSRGRLSPEDLAEIPGVCFHPAPGEVRVNPPGRPIDRLDDLPFPKRNIRPGARNIHVFSSRGCVNRCKFCASTVHWRRFRAHSASRFVSELRHLIDRYQATSIFLLDDLFFADRKRVFEIRDIMAQEDLLGRLTFHGFITSNLARRDMLEAAREIGFRSLRFGAETGSDRLLKEIKGRWASVAAHQRCIDLCRELGLSVRAPFMFGSPGETEEDLQQTHAFLQRNKGGLEIDGFYLTVPVPGTPYWELAKKKGLVSDTMDWSRLNLDILKKQSFDFRRAIYLNGENMPLERLLEHIERIRQEFLPAA